MVSPPRLAATTTQFADASTGTWYAAQNTAVSASSGSVSTYRTARASSASHSLSSAATGPASSATQSTARRTSGKFPNGAITRPSDEPEVAEESGVTGSAAPVGDACSFMDPP